MKKCCESFFHKFLMIKIVPDDKIISRDGKIIADIDYCPMCGEKLPLRREDDEETKQV